MKRFFSSILLPGSMMIALAIPGTASAQTSSSKAVYGASSRQLLTLDAHPPAGTKLVRFMIDDMQVAELTDLYAQKTGNAPNWSTVVDPAWFDKGKHTLHILASSGGPLQQVETREVTGTKQNDPQRQSLAGGWEFASELELPAGALDGDIPAAVANGYNQGTWKKILVPNSLGAVDTNWNRYEGIIGVYRKELDINATPTEQVNLLLESCYWSGKVFVNGQFAGATHGGYLPTRFPVSKFLKQGRNTVCVVVDNRFTTMGVLKRINEFYWNWGGLLQEVFLERFPAATLTDLRAEGTAGGGLQLYATGLNSTATAVRKTVTLEVYDAGNRKVKGPVTVTVTIPPGTQILNFSSLQLSNITKWELEKPYLYTVKMKGDFGVLEQHTGFRDVVVKGSDVLLNGKPVEDLQGFDRHADYPGLGRTQPSGLAYQELKLYRDKGFRFFRPAHYPTTPAQLDAADELGLLVIEEVNVTGLKGAIMGSQEVRDFGKQQITKMIQRDRSHPALIAFSVGNENLTDEDGAPEYVKEVIATGRALEPHRLYTQVTHRYTLDRTFMYQDFVCQNYYAGWYAKDINSITGILDAVQAYAGNKPIILSEYGAEAIPGKMGTAKSTELYQGFVVDGHNRLLNNRKHFFGKMYWCVTDFWCRPNWTGGNPEPRPPFHYKSLISLDRTHRKLGWRVMFSPIRIILNPHTVKATDLGGDIILPADRDTAIVQTITIREVRGIGAKGTFRVTPPAGFTASITEAPFDVKPEEGKSFTVTLTGRIAKGQSADCLVQAIVDEDTEAQPMVISLKAKE